LIDPKQSKSSIHGLQLAVPHWSPDGGDIYLVSSKGGDQWI
jgi:hypothetical protein